MGEDIDGAMQQAAQPGRQVRVDSLIAATGISLLFGVGRKGVASLAVLR